jgi:hypothetical protein
MPLSGFFLKKKPPSKDLVWHMNWRTDLQWEGARLAKSKSQVGGPDDPRVCPTQQA